MKIMLWHKSKRGAHCMRNLPADDKIIEREIRKLFRRRINATLQTIGAEGVEKIGGVERNYEGVWVWWFESTAAKAGAK